jgi:D-serine deaminase-like pyridoxal phosphate-dependent protein
MSVPDPASAPGAALDIPSGIDTPALVVDLARVRANLDAMADHAQRHGVALYPHVKTHRTLEFAQLEIEHGANGLTVAKLSEAEVFIDGGFRELLMAYPICGASKVERALELTARAHLRLTVDSLDAARVLSDAFAGAGRRAEVMVAVDSGLHREGLPPTDVPAFVRKLVTLPGIEFRGVLTHEGHAYTFEDSDARDAVAHDVGDLMAGIADELAAQGTPAEVVSTGASPTAWQAARPGVTEIRPGSYPFYDGTHVRLGAAGIERCAARVLATVVSHVAPDRALIDAGSKSFGADVIRNWREGDPWRHGIVIGHRGWDLFALSEEHGWLRWIGEGSPTTLAIGQTVQVLPVHICAVFHVLGSSYAVEDGRLVGHWVAQARDRSQ